MDAGRGPTITTTPRPPSPVAASLRALAYRCQYEGGASRELDEAIALAVLDAGGEVRLFGMDDREPSVKMFRYANGSVGTALQYTYSVDAAITLVPPHHLWELKRGIESRGIVWCLERDYDDDGAPTGYNAGFPARALCAAALYAWAELEERR